MLHLLYILAFTVLAFLAVTNLIRNLMTLGADSNRATSPWNQGSRPQSPRQTPSHPELVDDSGSFIDEPYLVMKSISVDDARERLDALYNSSPSAADQAPQDDA